VREKLPLAFRQLNWRMFWMRLVMYALLLGLVVGLTPGIYFTTSNLGAWFVTVVGFGLIIAILKPILQLVTLPLLFFSYGLVVIVINVIILMLLSSFFGHALTVEGWIPAIFGGVVLGVVGGFVESLLGLTPPIVPDSEEALKARVRFQDRGLIYVLFQAPSAELRKYAALPEPHAEPVPGAPEPQEVPDAQVILATLDAAEAPQPATGSAVAPAGPTSHGNRADGASPAVEEPA
jgi:putative membrane protein